MMRTLIFLLGFQSALFAALTSANYNLEPETVPSAQARDLSFSAGLFSGYAGMPFSGELSSGSYGIKQGFFNIVSPDLSEPAPVSALFASEDPDGNVLLSWSGGSDPDSWINGYRIFRAAGEEGEYKEAGGTGGTAFTDSAGLIYGVAYYYKVKPVDAGGNTSPGGDPAAKVLSKSFASSVTTLTAAPCAGGAVRLSWKEPPGAAYFRVYRSSVSGDTGAVICADGAVPGSPYLDTLSNGLVDGLRYFYTVRYVDGAGNEQQKGNNQSSSPCDASPPSEAKPCSSTHPAGVTVENNSPEFNWNESLDKNSASGGSGGMRGYRVALSRLSGLAYSPDWETVAGFSKSYSGIDDGDWYFYVSAEDLAGNYSPPSEYRISVLTKGEIAGKLTAKDGERALGSLLVELLKGTERVASSRTGTDGSFSFKNVPFGAYTVRALIPGCAPWQSGELAVSKDSPNVSKSAVVALVPVLSFGEVTAYPNPVRGGSITFVYPSEPGSTVRIEIFDQAGRRVQTVSDGPAVSPVSETVCAAEELKSGVYFYVIRTASAASINKKFAPKSFTVVRR